MIYGPEVRVKSQFKQVRLTEKPTLEAQEIPILKSKTEKKVYDLQKSVAQNMTENEKVLYGVGSRNPTNCRKLELLGKGGCAVVWLCLKDENELVAVK